MAAKLLETAPLIVEEEEGLVLDDGASDGSAKIVFVMNGPTASRLLVEPVVGVECGVAEELIKAGVELVRPRAGNNVNQRCAGKPVLSTEIRLLHLELFHCVD